MPSILDIIQQGKRDLLRGEIAMTQRMLAAYELVWLEVERQLLRLDTNLQASGTLESGAVDAWLRQQDWYTQLLRSIDVQFARFETDAATVLGRTQVEAVGVSREAGVKVRRWIDDRAGSGFVADVRPQVFERWVSATLPDSPLRASIERHGIEAAKVIERRMTEGIGSGRGVRTIVSGIRSELGMDSPKPYELTTLVRTETMRAYRGSFRDDMDAMGTDVIPQMEWLAAHSVRTCPACLAMDGRRFPSDNLIDKFHVACRCVWRPVVNETLVPGANPPRKLGSEYFAELPEKDQLRILRSQGRLDAYQAGVPLSEMVGERANATWGPSVYIKPVRDLPGGGVPEPPEMQWARKLYDKASLAEPGVTHDLQRISQTIDGDLAGLDSRLKTLDSTARKIADGAKQPGVSIEDEAGAIMDNLRYTYELNPRTYGTGVEQVTRALAAAGYMPVRFKNFWEADGGYAGINTVWKTASGQFVELQFTTPQALYVKEMVSHPLYEQLRVLEADSPEAQEIREEINRLWRSVRADPPSFNGLDDAREWFP